MSDGGVGVGVGENLEVTGEGMGEGPAEKYKEGGKGNKSRLNFTSLFRSFTPERPEETAEIQARVRSNLCHFC